MTVRYGNPGSGVNATSEPVAGSSVGSLGPGEVEGASTGGGNFPFTYEHPVAWNQMRKFFIKMLGEDDAKKMLSMLEENSKSLEDFLDVAYLKTNGGTVDGYTRFKGTVEFQGNVIGAVPTGTVIPYAGATNSPPPVGWLLADNQEVRISTYTRLYNVLTNQGSVFPYGANTNGSGGAGNTHFRLPNLAGRIPVSKDSNQTEFDTIGETGGAKTHTLTTSEIPSHQHGIGYNFAARDAGTSGFAVPDSLNTFTYNSVATGGGAAHNNLQPYIVMSYLIKY